MPERPIGSALKALAGSNVSRGFESRPLCLTNYRLDRRFVLRPLGLNLMSVGTFTVGAFLLPTGLALACAALVALLVINAASLALRPPVVVRTSAADVRVGGRLTVRRITMPWTDVEGVEHADDRLYFTRGDETMLSFPLAYVGSRRDELIRDVYDRLNAANGYRRFEPS